MVLSEVSVRMTRTDRSLPWGFGIRDGHGSGSVVNEIQATGLADRAYMKCGDRILRVNGRPVTSYHDAENAIASSGSVVEMLVERNVAPFGSIYADHHGMDFSYPFNAIDYSSKFGSDRTSTNYSSNKMVTGGRSSNYGSDSRLYSSADHQSAANFINSNLVHHPPQQHTDVSANVTSVDKSGIMFPSVRGNMEKFQESNRWNWIEPGTWFPTRFGRGNVGDAYSSTTSFRSTRERSAPTFPSPVRYNLSNTTSRLSHSPQPVHHHTSPSFGSGGNNYRPSTVSSQNFHSHHSSHAYKQFPRLGEIDSRHRSSRPKSPIFVMGPNQQSSTRSHQHHHQQQHQHHFTTSSHQPAPPISRPVPVVPAPAARHSASPVAAGRIHSPSPFKAAGAGSAGGGGQHHQHQFQDQNFNSPRALYSHNTAVDEYLKQTGGMFGSDAKTIEAERQKQEEQASATLRLIQERENRSGHHDPPGDRPWEGSLRKLATGTY